MGRIVRRRQRHRKGSMHEEVGVRSAPGSQVRQEAQAKEGLGSGLLVIGWLQHPQAWADLELTCGARAQMRIHSGK